MNIFADFTARIIEIIQRLELKSQDGGPLDLSRITVEPPRDPSHGDLATNAAMVLSKPTGEKPRVLAERIVSELAKDVDVAQVDVAGPGFVNLKLHDAFWQRQLGMMLGEGAGYGRSTHGGGVKVNVEYVSANPTGPMHVGHARGAVVGDTLANMLAFVGYDVTKEYLINDAGVQIDVLGRSVMWRYQEALGNAGDKPEPFYPGDYLVPVGQALVAEHGAALLQMPEGEMMAIIKDKTIDMMMAVIRDDLALLNVNHDVFFSERTLHANGAAKIRTALNKLTLEGHVYRGTLPPPKGEKNEEWEDREQLLFRSTAVGDDIDRALMKSDGSYTYFAADVAYIYDKINRGYKELIYVLGADHGGYVKRLQALARAVSGGTVSLDVLLCNLVKLTRDGVEVRMSKRAGEFVTLREVVEEVGRDPVRFMMLYRKSDAPLDFDFAKVLEKSKDNPVFYVQYASARCHSVFRQAREQISDISFDRRALAAQAHLLTEESEISLVRKLAEYPRLLISAAEKLTSLTDWRFTFMTLPVLSMLNGIVAMMTSAYGLLSLTTDYCPRPGWDWCRR